MRSWPRTFTFWQRAVEESPRLNIDRVQVVDESELPGTVLAAGDRLVIAERSSAIEVMEVQPAGKRRMSAGEVLRGNAVEVGGAV